MDFPTAACVAITIKQALLLPHRAEVLPGAVEALHPEAITMAAVALPEVQPGLPAEIPSRAHSTAVGASVHPTRFRVLQVAGVNTGGFT